MLSRRTVLAAAVASSAPSVRAEEGRDVRDSAGRNVVLPPHVSRVLPAGAPAAILLWSLVPEMMTGWVRRPGPAALAFLPQEAAALPEVGRLTGRGGTANVEAASVDDTMAPSTSAWGHSSPHSHAGTATRPACRCPASRRPG